MFLRLKYDVSRLADSLCKTSIKLSFKHENLLLNVVIFTNKAWMKLSI